MSIPKIKITSIRKNEKIELNCDCSTTANFGVVQPTFCREMVPYSKFTIQTASRVLLAGMPVPTFGRMFMKHFHTFVPYNDVCPQYDAFLAGQPYTPSDGISYYPKQLPVLKLQKVSQYILAKWADFTIYIHDEDATYEKHSDYRVNTTWTPVLLNRIETGPDANGLSDLKNAWTGLFHTFGEQLFYGEQVSDSFSRGKNILAPAYGDTPRGNAGNREGRCLCGDYFVNLSNSIYSSDDRFSVNTTENPQGGVVFQSNRYITWEDADFISTFGVNGKYLVCFKLTPVGKRIRQILVGLGYQMTPNLPHDSNWLKLLSYYKSFFNLFRPKREISYTSSIGYKLTKLMENPDADERLFNSQGGATGEPGYIYFPTEPVQQFFDELGLNCSYYLKQDYFSMSVLTPNDNYSHHTAEDSNSDFVINTPSKAVAPETADVKNIVNVGSTRNSEKGSEVYIKNPSNPALIQLAMQVLRYVNKNTVVGRSIHDYIRAHYGLSLDSSHDLDSVYKIGESETPISVSELMNSAATEQMELGEFAGRGRGSSGSEVFTFENKNTHGVWLTLSVIIPQSGFYQGVLKENDAIKRFDFFTPEFDAAGYQVLARSEVSLDYPFQSDQFKIADGNDRAVNPDAAFGFVPRYSHLKVGRNIVNGDLSLRGLRNSMSGYTLDRMIPYDRIRVASLRNSEGVYDTKECYSAPLFDIGVVRDSFRQIDPTDHLGNYNRIFYYGRNDYDHFIINIAFEVNGYSPVKSLQDSFDTVDAEEAKFVEISHS